MAKFEAFDEVFFIHENHICKAVVTGISESVNTMTNENGDNIVGPKVVRYSFKTGHSEIHKIENEVFKSLVEVVQGVKIRDIFEEYKEYLSDCF